MRRTQPPLSVPVEKEKRLNEIAVQIKTIEPSCGERANLRNELFLLAFDLYDDTSNAFLDSLLEACKKYEPERGPFSYYLKFLHAKRSKDHVRSDQRHAPNADSLDAAVSDENSLTLGDFVADQNADDPGQISRLDGKLADLTAQILNFTKRHNGKAANETRQSWFRMFYTEDMTLVSKEWPANLLHERDVFAAMDLQYLDYYMLRVCRKINEISVSPLKPYHEVVSAQESMEETPLPIKADVSLAFWEICRGVKNGASARSNQHRFYDDMIRELEQTEA